MLSCAPDPSATLCVRCACVSTLPFTLAGTQGAQTTALPFVGVAHATCLAQRVPSGAVVVCRVLSTTFLVDLLWEACRVVVRMLTIVAERLRLSRFAGLSTSIILCWPAAQAPQSPPSSRRSFACQKALPVLVEAAAPNSAKIAQTWVETAPKLGNAASELVGTASELAEPAVGRNRSALAETAPDSVELSRDLADTAEGEPKRLQLASQPIRGWPKTAQSWSSLSYVIRLGASGEESPCFRRGPVVAHDRGEKDRNEYVCGRQHASHMNKGGMVDTRGSCRCDCRRRRGRCC